MMALLGSLGMRGFYSVDIHEVLRPANHEPQCVLGRALCTEKGRGADDRASITNALINGKLGTLWIQGVTLSKKPLQIGFMARYDLLAFE